MPVDIKAKLEELARQFRIAGHTLVARAEDADLAVINTCAVTAAASSDSRQIIRQAERAGIPAVVVTGCYATLEPEETLRIPGVVRVVSNRQKDTLVQDVLNLDGIPEPGLTAREPLPGPHGHTRAFIKVQDGCDNFCTYCVTRLARGKGSAPGGNSCPYSCANGRNPGSRAFGRDSVVGAGFTLTFNYGTCCRKFWGYDVPRVRLSFAGTWTWMRFLPPVGKFPLCLPALPLQSGSEARARAWRDAHSG